MCWLLVIVRPFALQVRLSLCAGKRSDKRRGLAWAANPGPGVQVLKILNALELDSLGVSVSDCGCLGACRPLGLATDVKRHAFGTSDAYTC